MVVVTVVERGGLVGWLVYIMSDASLLRNNAFNFEFTWTWIHNNNNYYYSTLSTYSKSKSRCSAIDAKALRKSNGKSLCEFLFIKVFKQL